MNVFFPPPPPFSFRAHSESLSWTQCFVQVDLLFACARRRILYCTFLKTFVETESFTNLLAFAVHMAPSAVAFLQLPLWINFETNKWALSLFVEIYFGESVEPWMQEVGGLG